MVRLPIPQRLHTHLSSRSNASTPGQSRSTSPMRFPDSKPPLILKVNVLRVSDISVSAAEITSSSAGGSLRLTESPRCNRGAISRPKIEAVLATR